MLDEGPSVCERCGGELRKVIHPTGIIFKGGGFYKTDSRSSSSSGAGGASRRRGRDRAMGPRPRHPRKRRRPATPAPRRSRPAAAPPRVRAEATRPTGLAGAAAAAAEARRRREGSSHSGSSRTPTWLVALETSRAEASQNAPPARAATGLAAPLDRYGRTRRSGPTGPSPGSLCLSRSSWARRAARASLSAAAATASRGAGAGVADVRRSRRWGAAADRGRLGLRRDLGLGCNDGLRLRLSVGDDGLRLDRLLLDGIGVGSGSGIASTIGSTSTIGWASASVASARPRAVPAARAEGAVVRSVTGQGVEDCASADGTTQVPAARLAPLAAAGVVVPAVGAGVLATVDAEAEGFVEGIQLLGGQHLGLGAHRVVDRVREESWLMM